MPPLHLYLAFMAITTILMLIPGPNVAPIAATSVRGGTRQGLLTVAGTSAAFLVHVALTVIGLAALLGALGAWFGWVRWIGVAYLLWAVTFLGLAVAIDSGWAVLAGRARFLLARHGRLRNRLSGGLLIGTGIGLAAARHR